MKIYNAATNLVLQYHRCSLYILTYILTIYASHINHNCDSQIYSLFLFLNKRRTHRQYSRKVTAATTARNKRIMFGLTPTAINTPPPHHSYLLSPAASLHHSAQLKETSWSKKMLTVATPLFSLMLRFGWIFFHVLSEQLKGAVNRCDRDDKVKVKFEF